MQRFVCFITFPLFTEGKQINIQSLEVAVTLLCSDFPTLLVLLQNPHLKQSNQCKYSMYDLPAIEYIYIFWTVDAMFALPLSLTYVFSHLPCTGPKAGGSSHGQFHVSHHCHDNK